MTSRWVLLARLANLISRYDNLRMWLIVVSALMWPIVHAQLELPHFVRCSVQGVVNVSEGRRITSVANSDFNSSSELHPLLYFGSATKPWAVIVAYGEMRFEILDKKIAKQWNVESSRIPGKAVFVHAKSKATLPDIRVYCVRSDL